MIIAAIYSIIQHAVYNNNEVVRIYLVSEKKSSREEYMYARTSVYWYVT